jgi:hypothetical protein
MCAHEDDTDGPAERQHLREIIAVRAGSRDMYGANRLNYLNDFSTLAFARSIGCETCRAL